MAGVAAIVGLLTSVAGLAQSSSASKAAQGITEEQWAMTKEEKKAKYTSDIATYGENIQQIQADIGTLTEQKGFTLGQFGLESQKANRAMKEAYGASGATVGVGTPLEEMQKQAQQQELQAGMIEKSYQAGLERLKGEKKTAERLKGETQSLLDELFPPEPEKPAEDTTTPPKTGGQPPDVKEPYEGQQKTTGAGKNIRNWVYRNGKWVEVGH